jgi:hypothetical protein
MLRKVYIQHNSACPRKRFTPNCGCTCYEFQICDLEKFCNAHQSATVFLQEQFRAGIGLNFITAGAMLHEALRGYVVPGMARFTREDSGAVFWIVSPASMWAQGLENVRSRYGIRSYLPSNIRLLPSGQLDEGEFRESILRSPICASGYVNKQAFEEAGGVEAYVSFARTWYSEGL